MKKSFSVFLGFTVFVLPVFLWAATAGEDYKTGLSQYQAGKYEQAIASLQLAIKENPQSWQAYQLMGNAYLKMGDKAKALSAFQKSLDLHPDNPSLSEYVSKLKNENPSTGAKPVELSYNPTGKLYLELGPGRAFSTNGDNSTIYIYKVAGGYFIDKNFAAQLEFENNFIKQPNIAIRENKLRAEMKWVLDSKDIRPYGLAGPGIDLYELENGNDIYSTNYFDFLLGVGVQVNAFNFVNLFLEAKYDTVFAYGSTGSDIPIDVGINFNL